KAESRYGFISLLLYEWITTSSNGKRAHDEPLFIIMCS
ncbi:hypothetical protein D037_0061B, partial [Vibrio parahaemolyticus IDH02640]